MDVAPAEQRLKKLEELYIGLYSSPFMHLFLEHLSINMIL